MQKKKKICVIIENFEYAVLHDHRKAQYIEDTIRRYAQDHRKAAWLILGTRDMLTAFAAADRTIYQSGIVMIEESSSRPGGGM
jgi:hypothetical protein